MDETKITIQLDGKTVTFAELRKIIGLPADYCMGCHLGDDGPETHDMSYGCQHGPYREV